MKSEKTSISNVLFSKVRQRILGSLYSQPDVDFHTNEIIRLVQAGTGVVQRELGKLVSVDLITVKKIGNQKRYQANRDSLLFAELRSIALKTFGLADVLREALKPVAKKIRVSFIYGSIAKQEDTVSSDIDLMIIGDDLTYADLFELLNDAELQLRRKINPTFYTPSEWKRKSKARNNFVTQITKQPKIFLIGTDDELGQLR